MATRKVSAPVVVVPVKVYQLTYNRVLVQLSNGENREFPIENPISVSASQQNKNNKDWNLPWKEEKIQIPLAKCQGKAMYLKADGKSYFPVGIYAIHATNNGKEIYQLLYADLATGMAFHNSGGFPGKVEKCVSIEWHDVDFDEFREVA